jgi:hypothetical protein
MGKPLGQLSPCEFMLGVDSSAAIAERKSVGRAIFAPQTSLADMSFCITAFTKGLLRDHSHKLRHVYELGLVRDIAARSWAQFGARLFYIHLRSDKHSDAVFDDRTLYESLAAIFESTYLNTEQHNSFVCCQSGLEAYKSLLRVVK